MEQLPVEIALGPEFVFRPIFACPVSRDMSTPDNPPLALPCGHVLAEQSVAKLLKNRWGGRRGWGAGLGRGVWSCPKVKQPVLRCE